jgi:RNA polymerase sigma-70 factor (ECF subfamily)
LRSSPGPRSLPASTTTEWVRARERCLREARRIVRDPSAADDVVQEALLRGWRRRADCKTPDAPLPWLLAITRNEALRYGARPQHASEIAVEDPSAWDASPAAADGDPIVDRLNVQAALARLDDQDRRLLRMRYENDLTQTEIARRLGVPEGTVKVRLHRLRHHLRGEIA